MLSNLMLFENLEDIRKFLRSSFFVLSVVALIAGAMGSLMSGMWDFVPPKEGVFSFGSYFEGMKFGAFLAGLGLIPYWMFHAVIGNLRLSWANVRFKALRLLWVVCWAGFLVFFLSRGLAI